MLSVRLLSYLKKEKLAKMVTRCQSLSLVVIRCTSRCDSFSFVVPLVVIRCYSMYLPLVCLFINDLVRVEDQSVEEQELKVPTTFLSFVIVIKLIFKLKVLKKMLTSWRNKKDKRFSLLLLTFCRRRI